MATTIPDLVIALEQSLLPLAARLARRFGADVDLLLVRELRLSDQSAAVFGAVAADGEVILDHHAIDASSLTERRIVRLASAEWRVLERLDRELRGGRPPVEVRGRNVLLLVDGVGEVALRCAEAVVRAGGARSLDVLRSSSAQHPADGGSR